MFELGESSEKEHIAILELLKKSSVQRIVLVGNWPHIEGLNASYYKTSQDLKEQLIKMPISNSTILIKGSRGVKLETVVDNL